METYNVVMRLGVSFPFDTTEILATQEYGCSSTALLARSHLGLFQPNIVNCVSKCIHFVAAVCVTICRDELEEVELCSSGQSSVHDQSLA